MPAVTLNERTQDVLRWIAHRGASLPVVHGGGHGERNRVLARMESGLNYSPIMAGRILERLVNEGLLCEESPRVFRCTPLVDLWIEEHA